MYIESVYFIYIYIYISCMKVKRHSTSKDLWPSLHRKSDLFLDICSILRRWPVFQPFVFTRTLICMILRFRPSPSLSMYMCTNITLCIKRRIWAKGYTRTCNIVYVPWYRYRHKLAKSCTSWKKNLMIPGDLVPRPALRCDVQTALGVDLAGAPKEWARNQGFHADLDRVSVWDIDV